MKARALVYPISLSAVAVPRSGVALDFLYRHGRKQHEAAVPPLSRLLHPREMPVVASAQVLVASVKHLKLSGTNLGGIVCVSKKQDEEQSVSER